MNATKETITVARSYYDAMGRKDLPEIEKYLHPDVHFKAPLAQTKGKEALLESIEKFFSLFHSSTIHAKFGDEDSAMVVYDLDCPQPIGLFRSVALLRFQDGLIVDVELFYDARPFVD